MIESIIVEMTDRGFDLNCGPHTCGLLGYYAVFYVEQEDRCLIYDWMESGHGVSLLEALQMAQQMALGQFYGPVPKAEEFIP
jgi:hypothetical protein